MTVALTNTWTYPTTVFAGPDALQRLPEALDKAAIARPLLVTDSGLAASPMISQALSLIAAGGHKVVVFANVQGNPTAENLATGIQAFREGGHDGVVAIGGGSALDIGKCIAFMARQTRPVWDFEDVGDWWTRADAGAIASSIAIPTTAGTGSEVGRAVVITNSVTREKKVIFHPKMLPSVAILDPVLAASLPKHLTIGTGMDALAHCFEAYCVETFHPIADAIALEGMRIVKDTLPQVAENGNDLDGRMLMFAAASMGGAAFQKGLGAIHSLSHPLGARYNTHHGMTNAVLFPYVALANRRAIEAKVETIARVLRLPDPSFGAFLSWLLMFRQQLGVPHTLTEMGMEIDEGNLSAIAEAATRDPTALSNPRPLDASQFRLILSAAISGQLTLEV
ncbi:alcohol dehydrogenase [Labrys miyagiensis]